MVIALAGLMGASVASGSSSLTSPDNLRPVLAMLKKYGVHKIDTARVYNGGRSEEDLGAMEARHDFKIATKAPGFSPGSLAYQAVIDNCNKSLAALKQDSIALYYFHGPDRRTPLEESCKAIHELHQEGKIDTFGVSNFNVKEVQEIYDICKRNSWTTPKVYQGGFNGLARGAETQLFPTLRELGMSFYAYSPLAGGYFSKTSEQLRKPAQGSRMDQMKHFSSMYVDEGSLMLHSKLEDVCAKESVSMKEAALRWLMHHSVLGDQDGVIIGASSKEQMEENLKSCTGGPLPQSIVDMFEELWAKFSEGRPDRLRYSV